MCPDIESLVNGDRCHDAIRLAPCRDRRHWRTGRLCSAERARLYDGHHHQHQSGRLGEYVDPDSRFSDSDKSKTTINQGNTTLQFGGRPSFDQQYNSNRMFDPASRLENER